MAEIPEVVTLTTISKDWGNAVASRTVQRYSSVANRTSEHPSPVEGDLSYLEDSNTVWVYDGTAWVQLVPGPVATANIADDAVTGDKLANNINGSLVVSAATSAPGLTAIPATSFGNLMTLGITIPATWVSWGCEVTGKTAIRQTGDSTSSPTSRIFLQVTVDGTADGNYATRVGRYAFGGSFGFTDSELTVPIHGFRTGMTTTGSRNIILQGHRQSLDNVYSILNTSLSARAWRIT